MQQIMLNSRKKNLVKSLEIICDLPLNTKVIFFYLANLSDENGFCSPSLIDIAYSCDTTEHTVVKHINRLVETGILTKETRKGMSAKRCGNKTNLYIINELNKG